MIAVAIGGAGGAVGVSACPAVVMLQYRSVARGDACVVVGVGGDAADVAVVVDVDPVMFSCARCHL